MNKTKEHVLPLWALELGGNPSRTTAIGMDFRTAKPRRFAADQFTAPACESCNATSERSIEAPAKAVVTRLLAEGRISAEGITVLLDWLDKVRTGIWLTFRYLDRNSGGIQPNFGIFDRIRRKDRMVAIYRLPGSTRGVGTTGLNLPGAQLIPGAFAVRLNDYVMFNLSGDFLLAARAGLPSFRHTGFSEDRRPLFVSGHFQPGTGRWKFPLIRGLSLPAASLEVYQPVIPVEAARTRELADLYLKPELALLRPDFDSRLCAALKREGRGYVYLESDETVDVLQCDRRDHELAIADSVHAAQEHLLDAFNDGTWQFDSASRTHVRSSIRQAKAFERLMRKSIAVLRNESAPRRPLK